jgi:hypothetical protein
MLSSFNSHQVFLFLVVIIIFSSTRTVYSCRRASFKTVILRYVLIHKVQWVSWWRRPNKPSPYQETFPPSNGTPSTRCGPFPEQTDSYGNKHLALPLDCVTCTPATLPLNNWEGCLYQIFSSIWSTAPVASFFLTVP